MTDSVATLTLLIREVRTCFNQLKSLAEHLHADLDVNPSMRAILEGLSQRSPQTAPDIARARGVSRQHVQKIVNTLLDRGFIRVLDNPDHKRSVMYALTPQGGAIFAEMRTREEEPLKTLSRNLPEPGLKAAGSTLARLNREIEVIMEGNRDGSAL